MKFAKLVDARKAIWERLLKELQYNDSIGSLLDEDCEDDADKAMMKKAVVQVRACLERRVRNGDIR